MTGEKKFFIGVAIATCVALGAGVLFLMRSGNQSSTAVDATLLVREDSQKIAALSSSVTLVEFSDYQCPACGSYHPVIKQLLSELDGKFNFVYRNFPLPKHQNARIAAYAAEAAGEQGKFWDMHDKLFEDQDRWSEQNSAKEIFIEYARNLGLDNNRFKNDIDSSKIKNKMTRDVGDGNAAGVNSTPTFFLNGEKLKNPGSYEQFKTLIQAAIEKAPLPQVTGEEQYHAHFNIKAYINNKSIDFSLPQYQSTEEQELNQNIHFHDGNGDVVHVHKRGMTLGDLFASIHTELPPRTRLHVNDEVISSDWPSYQPQDGDRLLLSVSQHVDALQIQKESVKDTACIYSEKCPERGKPPTENCVGGLGSGCDE